MSFIYVASPYSHDDEQVREARYRAVMHYCANALTALHHVYSPIVHCHEMALRYSLPKDTKFWRRYNYAMLNSARALEVLMLPGWLESEGVSDETKYATGLALPIHHVDLTHKWLQGDFAELKTPA